MISSIRDLKEITNVIGNVIGLLTAFLSMIAAVSLVVGGIGIMNIMLVSVTERTREIGIRLAIGALELDVLFQFLIEAVALSLLGGLVGVSLGLCISGLICLVLKLPVRSRLGDRRARARHLGDHRHDFRLFPARAAPPASTRSKR